MKANWCVEETDGHWRCGLCPHGCLLKTGQDGLCGVRGVRDGEAVALGYGQVSARHLDPIEKKPLYHFYPGTRILSIGGWGCNFRCRYCQNCQIAQVVPEFDERQAVSPEEIVRAALACGSIGVAYTYNEPLIGYEFVCETACAVHEAGLVNVLVTNGYMNPEPATKLLRVIDAVNTDIKSFRDAFYREQCGGRVEPVLSFARQVAQAGVHQEITMLIIEGLHDLPDEVDALSQWMAEALGRNTVLHLTAYYPACQTTLPATSAKVLLEARAVALQRLPHVYIGNVPLREGTDTHCPNCGTLLIRRARNIVTTMDLSDDGACLQCGAKSGVRS